MRRASLVLALSLLPVVVVASDLELRGIRIGQTVEDAKAAHAGLLVDCGGVDEDEPRLVTPCRVGKSTMGGYVDIVDFRFYINREGTIEEVFKIIKPADHSALVDALTAKLGTPSSDETSEVTTRAGAVFDQRLVTWQTSGSRLTAKKRSSNVDEGMLLLERVLSEDEQRAEREFKARIAADDI